MNVLVALAWPNHIHHARAIRWFREVRNQGWATCSVTEAGFVRVSSNTRVIPDARTPREAIALLKEIRNLPGHTFWADDISPADPEGIAFDRMVGYRQITDAHLLALAIRNGGRLSTFDTGIPELMPDLDQNVIELIP